MYRWCQWQLFRPSVYLQYAGSTGRSVLSNKKKKRNLRKYFPKKKIYFEHPVAQVKSINFEIVSKNLSINLSNSKITLNLFVGFAIIFPSNIIFLYCFCFCNLQKCIYSYKMMIIFIQKKNFVFNKNLILIFLFRICM